MNTNESIQIILYPDLREKVNELAFKYEKLVWYGRSGCGLDQHPPELKEKVLNARSKYEEIMFFICFFLIRSPGYKKVRGNVRNSQEIQRQIRKF